MENRNLTKSLAMTGSFSALVVVLGITKLGLIPLGPTASITILQIPVILIAMLCGCVESLVVGLSFGVLSLVQAAMSPSGVLDPFFVNPLISILPRILLGLVSWLLWKGFITVKMPKVLAAAFTGFIATVAHTVMVIGCLYIFGNGVKEAMGGAGYFAVMGLLLPQACLEATASTIVCAAVSGLLFVSKNKKSKLSQEED